MKKLFVLLLLILIAFSSFLFAGTIHSVSGTVTYEAGGSPAAITFSAYITTRPDEILTESSAGCGYDNGAYYVQCGNFATAWAGGDTLYIEINDGSGGIAYGRVVLTYNPNDLLNLVIYPPEIEVAPGSKDFGSVLTGSHISQAFVLSNLAISRLSISSVQITGSSDFSITSGGGAFHLFENETRNIVVKFAPVSVGALSGTLVIHSNDPDEGTLNIPLSGTGVGHPDIAVSTQNIDFGNVYLNASEIRTFQIISEGSADLSVSQIYFSDDANGQFSITSGGGSFTLSPGNNRTVTVAFNPTLSGVQQAILEIQSNDVDENPVQISLEGTGIVQDIAVNPASHDFGDVVLGNQQSQVFSIVNEGNADLTVSSLDFSGSHNALFSLGSSFSQSVLSPAQTLQIEIVFTPDTPGVKSATLEVTSDDPDENPFIISLAGICVVPDILVTPASHNYGFISLDNSSSQVFVVENEGDSPLHVDEIRILGNDPADFAILQGSAPKTIPSQGSYNVTVEFEPKTLGAKSATLRIGSDDPDENPFDIPLSGNDETPDIQTDKSDLNFGDVILESQITKSIQLTNAGRINLEISAISITGSHAGSYQILTGGVPVVLSESESQAVEVQFHPVSVGEKTASLVITSNDPDENPLTIPITGMGAITDEDPPYLEDMYPPAYSYGMPTNARIQCQIKDDIYGPDLQTLFVSVNETSIIINGQDQTGGQVQILSSGNCLKFVYAPLFRFKANSLFLVRVRCRDLSTAANMLDQSYQLRVGPAYMIYIYNQTLTSDSLYIEEPNTGFQLNMSENALRDTFNTVLGFINQWPELPDTVQSIGKVFVFDPYGLTFSKPVTVSIPYDQADLQALDISADALSLWMFNPLNNQWQMIPHVPTHSDLIAASVDKLSYFTLGKILTPNVHVDHERMQIPEQFALSQNYPNPFNHQTRFTYALPEPSVVRFEIYDAMGRLVAHYELGMQNAGSYQFHWDSRNTSNQILPSGIYLLRFQGEKFIQLRKMLMVK